MRILNYDLQTLDQYNIGISEVLINQKTKEEYLGNTRYAGDLEAAIKIVLRQLRKDALHECQTLEALSEKLEQLNRDVIAAIKEVKPCP